MTSLETIMWPTTATQTFLTTPLQPPLTTFSTAQLRRRNQHLTLISAAASSQDVGGLGQAVFSALKSSPSTPGSNPGKKVRQVEQPNQGKEISGSDILWAMQKASVKKANSKKQQKKKMSGELKRDNIGKKVVDFDKIRPIVIKSDWATRLTDLEKRLQEFDTM